MGTPRVLLTGCGSPASQNLLQCLRAAPEPFHIVGADANLCHLEWGDLDAAYQSPLTCDPCYLEFLNSLCQSEGIEFLHGQPDWEVAFLAQQRDLLAAATFLPRPEVISLAQDKYASCLLWWRAGLCSDSPILVRGVADLEMAGAVFGLPFWVRATAGAGARGSCRAASIEQARAWLDYWRLCDVDWSFMAERYLPGPEYAFQSLWHEGRLITSSARERLEFVFPQHAPSGVTSSPAVARSVHDERVNEVAISAIVALDPGPHGLYGVDLKCDDDGIPRPTEINAGRLFTTSLFLAAAGCNLAYHYVCLGLGRPLPKLPRYNAIPAGLYWIRHIDCGQVLVREGDWRGARLSPALTRSPAGAPFALSVPSNRGDR